MSTCYVVILPQSPSDTDCFGDLNQSPTSIGAAALIYSEGVYKLSAHISVYEANLTLAATKGYGARAAHRNSTLEHTGSSSSDMAANA